MSNGVDANQGRLPRSEGRGLGSATFLALAATQFLTAANDNIFRWLVIGVGKDYVAPKDVSYVLMAGTVSFVLPYVLLAAPAGYLADRFSKRNVIIGCKTAEVLIMILGVTAIVIGRLWLLIAAVVLMGAQSALFSPSKLGSIPEMLKPQRISAANGLFGLTTVAATVAGMGVGSWLSDDAVTGFQGRERWWLSAAVLLGVALVGLGCSFAIGRLPAANARRRFPWDAPRQTWRDLRALAANRALLRVALGVAFFWALGALAQLNIDQFAAEGGARSETAKIPLLMALVFGVGSGSVLAGILSAGRVELGILPLGALGMIVCSISLFAVQGTIIEPASVWTAGFIAACVLLFGLGGGAGLFSVPLDAYLQHRSPRKSRGAILAAANLLTMGGVLVSAIVYYGLRAPVRPGSLDRVSQQLRGPALPAAAQRRVDELADRFEAAWRRGGSPELEAYLSEARGAERREALARLLWVEIRQRRARGESAGAAEYAKRYAGEEALIRSVFAQTGPQPLFTSQQVFLLGGLCTVPVLAYVVWLIPQASLRFLVWLGSLTVYRIRVRGQENLPAEGGALLAPNHVSYLDGVFLLLTSSRPIRMVAYAGSFRNGLLRRLGRMWGAIMISSGPKSIAAALRSAREALRNGELVCIFPEGQITRSGQLQAFRRGLMKILEGTEAPVVPVYLDELWGSIFSFEGGRFFWKRPRKWPYPISIHFGPPLARPADVHEVRRAVQDLGATAVQERTQRMTLLTRAFLRKCKRRLRRSKVADSTGADLSGGALLTRSLILRRLLRRRILTDEDRTVGLLLPPSVGALAANMALALDRRVAVNLNYTVSSGVLNSCIAQAGIRRVLTSRSFLNKLNLDLSAELVRLEDLREQVGWSDKLIGALQAYVVPVRLLERTLKLHHVKTDDLLTIIFTSGSTGDPKGVMLSYGNVAHNVEAVEQVVRLKPDDVLIGVLPFFHSFGYSITMWTAAAVDIKAAYHFNPLDGRRVGALCKEHGGTLLVATPTFLRHYLRRCEKESMTSLEVVVAGAEKLPIQLNDAFEEKFGVRPVEGYGTTELSPLVSVNVPPSRSIDTYHVDCKEGTVGRPVPGVSARVTDLATGETLGPGRSGMLWIKGPNVMRGYLNRPELTAEVMRDGWYVTGDLAAIDEDGFIRITGRQSRFSKIGGEMVPHVEIEEALAKIIGAAGEEGLPAAVTAVPDEKKGERLVVLHLKMDASPADVVKRLADQGFPSIYIPAPDSFLEVDSLPLLGVGKLDLKRVREIALERFSPGG